MRPMLTAYRTWRTHADPGLVGHDASESIGIVGCLVVAVGVWVVRPAVTDRTHEIIAIVNDGLQKTSDLTDTAAPA